MTRDSRQVSGFRTGGFAALGNSYFRRRYAILFYSLLLTMVAAPALGALGLRVGLIEVFLGANLIAAIIPMGNRNERRLLLVVLLAIAVVMRLGAGWLNEAILSAASLSIWTILALLAAASALTFALRAQSIDREHVYAALSAYLLAGVFFGVFYWVLEHIRPGSFGLAGEFSPNSAIYFSFVTLATLGYGDIVPRTDVARGLATLEGVGGQLFLAVLIARLVSLYARGEPGTGS
ncbi:MAG TPA: potassium channel family protein [Candidatus Binatia bacterium]|nr:potassium channel family protein [Candidatus Sulfotelmatobacter sp.]HYV75191.1 potassium channel family protein [Candidatus Binatia bacterium]